MTEIYSGAVYFGVPTGTYFTAFLIVMVMFLGPTLVALGWALTVGESQRPMLRLVPAFDRLRGVGEDRSGRRPDQAA